MAFLDMVFDITQTDYFSYTITIFKKKMYNLKTGERIIHTR